MVSLPGLELVVGGVVSVHLQTGLCSRQEDEGRRQKLEMCSEWDKASQVAQSCSMVVFQFLQFINNLFLRIFLSDCCWS